MKSKRLKKIEEQYVKFVYIEDDFLVGNWVFDFPPRYSRGQRKILKEKISKKLPVLFHLLRPESRELAWKLFSVEPLEQI